MKTHYSVAEFSALAGVTVKTLHHYDRHGLLRPERSRAGYRLYAPRDLERLEQIVALKSIGLSLSQIRTLLDGDAQTLAAALRGQRQALERKRTELTRAIRAIERVESKVHLYRALSRGGVLDRLIEAIDMQNDLEVMKRYFHTEPAWSRARRYFDEWPSDAWRELFRDIHAALGDDPATNESRLLVTRWETLFRNDSEGDFAFRAGLWRAFNDFDAWPDSLKAGIDFVALWKWVAEAAWARVGPDGRLPGTDPKRAPDRVSATKISLFRQIAASLDADPDGMQTHELIARWRALVDDEIGGDPEVRQALAKALANRHNWPLGYQRYVASLYDTTPETWSRVADVLTRQGIYRAQRDT